MKFLIIFGLVLFSLIFTSFIDEDLAFAQFSNQNTVKVSFEDDAAPSYEMPLAGKKFTLIQSYSWIQDETSRYSLVSYTLDGETVQIPRVARGDFRLNIPTGSSHIVMFTAVPQYALSVEGTNSFSYLPSSPTHDSWFDAGTDVSVNVQKSRVIEQNKVRQEIIAWSLDKIESWNIPKDDSVHFITPPIRMSDFHIVDFSSITQFKLTILSENGQMDGSGWYGDGTIVPITILHSNDGLVLYTFSELEGYDGEIIGNSAQIMINGPVTISAKFEKNYSLMAVVIIIPVLIVGVFFGKKIKNSKFRLGSRTSVEDITQAVEKAVETKLVETSPESKYIENYDEKITEYLSAQISEKLESLHNSKIISDSKYEKVKENLK
jgi:hypothetical protein